MSLHPRHLLRAMANALPAPVFTQCSLLGRLLRLLLRWQLLTLRLWWLECPLSPALVLTARLIKLRMDRLRLAMMRMVLLSLRHPWETLLTAGLLQGALLAGPATARAEPPPPAPATVCTCEPTAPVSAEGALPPLPPASAASSIPAPPPPPPLRLVTPFVPGSGADHVARTIARLWSQQRHEPVEVLNLPQSQGRVAARWVAQGDLSGRLVLLTSSTLMDVDPYIPRGRRDDHPREPVVPLDAFKLVARVGELPFAVVMPNGLLPGPLRQRSPLVDDPGSGRSGALTEVTVDAGADNGFTDTSQRMGAAFALADDLSASPEDPIPDDPSIAASQTRDGARERSAAPRSSVMPPLFGRPWLPPHTEWNGLLVSAHLAPSLVAELRRQFEELLTDPQVRVAVAQAGTDLWEWEPPREAAVVSPLPVQR